MSNHPEQDVAIPLRFLPKGESYRLELHRDGPRPSDIQTVAETVNSKTVLKIHLVRNGGFCGVLEQQPSPRGVGRREPVGRGESYSQSVSN